MSRPFLSLSIALAAIVSFAAVNDADAVKQWLSKNAVSLKSVEAEQGFSDLQPLKKTLKDVRIVGLGEGTHGSREFFQFKHRMLEFLVKEMGYRVFAIEASYPACWNINDYVLYGKGDAATALASQGFWTWDTNEVSDMIAWMRKYNEKVSDDKKVKFLGYDLQYLDRALTVITAYLQKVSPEYLPSAEEALKAFRLPLPEFTPRPAEVKEKSTTQLFNLMGYLAMHQTRFTRMSSAAEFNEALQEARVLAQFDEAYGRGRAPGARPTVALNFRDLYMAENIEYLVNLQPAGTRVVVWAHNGHIGFDKFGGGAQSMGEHLKKIYGDAYYAIGFTMYQGGFQSRDMSSGKGAGPLKEFTLPAAPEGSVGWYANLIGLDRFFVDFRSAPKDGAVADWLSTPHPMVSVGSGFATQWTDKQYMAPTKLRQTYDGLFYVKTTTRSRPNPSGVR